MTSSDGDVDVVWSVTDFNGTELTFRTDDVQDGTDDYGSSGSWRVEVRRNDDAQRLCVTVEVDADQFGELLDAVAPRHYAYLEGMQRSDEEHAEWRRQHEAEREREDAQRRFCVRSEAVRAQGGVGPGPRRIVGYKITIHTRECRFATSRDIRNSFRTAEEIRELEQQGKWLGSPVRQLTWCRSCRAITVKLIGFQVSIAHNEIALWRDAWFADPQKAVGMYPVVSDDDEDDPRWALIESIVETVTEQPDRRAADIP